MNTQNETNSGAFPAEFHFDKERDIPFGGPIHIERDDNGGIVELRSFYEAGVFAVNELKAWHDIIGTESSD